MTEIRELKDHIRWLQDQASCGDAVVKLGAKIDELDSALAEVLEPINQLVIAFGGLIEHIDEQTKAINNHVAMLKDMVATAQNDGSAATLCIAVGQAAETAQVGQADQA
jgi:hypothetical protein